MKAAKPPLRHTHMVYEPRSFSSRAQWQRYADWLRLNSRVSLALLPAAPKTPLRPRIFDRTTIKDYSREAEAGRVPPRDCICEKVYFESVPGFYVTGNLFRPVPGRVSRRDAPGILCPHGHWPDGRLHDWDIKGSVIARCISFARMGAVVFSYDMVGYNDSCQVPHREFQGDPHWGLSLMALQTYNSIRALDFLLSIPEVDPARLAATGCSGGGTQTFALGAVDPRLAAAAPVCMISLNMQGGCLCENAPLLRVHATSLELGRLFAPKPLFVCSCTTDWTKNTPRVELPAIKAVYRLFGAAKRVNDLHVKAEHGYNLEMREGAYGFFNKWFFGAKSAKPVSEAQFLVRPVLRDRMLWWGRKAPQAIAPAKFKALWRRHVETALRPALRDAGTARRQLGPLLPHVLAMVPAEFDERSPAKPEGIRVRVEGDSLVVSPRPGVADRTGEVTFYTAYNPAPVADRVREILAAVAKAARPVRLVGNGAAGPWCLLAAAVSPRVRSVDADLCGFNPEKDAAWTRHMNLPSIRQIGGLATVFALLGKRLLRLRNASPAAARLAKRFAR